MPFIRNTSKIWSEQVPGARWYRADLHIHTLDDHPASNLTWPSGINGPATDLQTQEAYARAFLQSSIKNGIEVLGLTPHAVRAGNSDETSATWKIIEIWNKENDDDGVPFRDKIYAIFPGFEPNFSDGDEGLHLLFLFDPEIGRDKYLAAFNAVMGALPPWDGGSLRMSPTKSIEAFKIIKDLHKRLKGDWNYLVLAPHAFQNRGLFSSLKSQILEWYQHNYISAIELKDGWLPHDAYQDKPWLEKGMKKYHHAFFHSTDAYSITDIGRRFSFIKLASPRIEALRQAFLASDSRLRIPYEKNEEGKLCLSTVLPEPCPGGRPWLKSITVKGGTSFFAGVNTKNGVPIEQTFLLNPDLNCFIGGRMSGKSTFLDGIRVWFDHALPTDAEIKADVNDRAHKRFLSGDAEISAIIHGPCNPTAPNNKRWPARFYTQRELQKAVRYQETRREILYRLILSEAPGLIERATQLQELDRNLNKLVDKIDECRKKFEEVEEDLRTINNAKKALQKVNAAGISRLLETQADSSKLTVLRESIQKINQNILPVFESELEVLTSTSIKNELIRSVLNRENGEKGYYELTNEQKEAVLIIKNSLSLLEKCITEAQEVAQQSSAQVYGEVQKALIDEGGNAEDLNQFDALKEIAGDYERILNQHIKAKEEYKNAYNQFAKAHFKRSRIIREQRDAMKRVVQVVEDKFPNRIRVRIVKDGVFDVLGGWVKELKEGGITRWWNNRTSVLLSPISPTQIRRALNKKELSSLGMTDLVASSFASLMTLRRRLEIAALRCDDKYCIELKVGEGVNDYREIDELSGGAQVSVLLSLVLETDDSTPLIVDQPEDEIDKSYLFDVLLPALHRLKGRRQVIFATHDANIVVNGDADQVIFLVADHEHGRINVQGAIEESNVKSAIVKTLDGGRNAFFLRQAKYGF